MREKYGKIYLMDHGFLLAKDLLRCVETFQERFPVRGLDLTAAEETEDLIRVMVFNLPEHCRNRLADCCAFALHERTDCMEQKIYRALLTVSMFCVGLGGGILNVIVGGCMMCAVPKDMMGRMSALNSAVMAASMPIGPFLCSALVLS